MPKSDPVIVVTAADDGFALPLAVMVRSLIENISPRRKLVVYILDGGIRARNRQELLASWDLSRTRIEWLKPPRSRLRGLPDLAWYGLAIYFRLLAPELLPRTARRALYIDADALILDDITPLWKSSLGGKPLGAVQDTGFLFMKDADIPFADYPVSPSAKYFNSGILLMDLEHWCRQSLVDDTLAYLRTYKEHLSFPDQDALNVVLSGKWQELHPRWNVNLNDLYQKMPHLPQSEQGLCSEALARPGILHFMGEPKPWEKGCTNPRLFLFYYYLDRTQWVGWRPD